jgi:hypothetical protein
VKILVVIQGAYGKRILRHLETHCPKDWEINFIDLPMSLPLIIDEPEEFIPQTIPSSDLILFLSESAAASQLIPDIARCAHAKGVIAPIDHSSWLPMGLKGQVKEKLNALGIGSAFPKNFCTLTRNTYGYRDSAEPYENAVISEFATYFGRPKLEVKVDPKTRTIKDIVVQRSSACGSTYHAVKKIIGWSVDEVIPKAGLFCMQYPCLASMQMEHIDKDLYNTLMHLSGQIFNDQLEPHLSPYLTDKKKG